MQKESAHPPGLPSGLVNQPEDTSFANPDKQYDGFGISVDVVFRFKVLFSETGFLLEPEY